MRGLKSLIRSIVPESVINLYHGAESVVASAYYGNPSKKLIVIGVTGTKGKSTTCHMLAHILEHAGHHVGMISTPLIRIKGREKLNTSKMTMLGGRKTQRLLSVMLDAGCTHAIIETSSQGIVQNRHIAISYSVLALTNLFPEHLDAHGGFDNYMRAKLSLWDRPHHVSVLNADSEHISPFISHSKGDLFLFTTNNEYTSSNAHTTVIHASHIHGSSFSTEGHEVHLGLLGSFNIQNALAAATIACSLHVPLVTTTHALGSFKGTPGRMELIHEGQPFTVIVDYAHEPHGLEQVYTSLQDDKKGKLISLVGSAGGGRDTWRREEIGRLAGTYADIVIVTNEDPYDEDPQEIIDAIAKGALEKGKILNSTLFILSHRKDAIHKALSLAHDNDIVLFTGKGAEQWLMGSHGKKTPWDEREIVRASLRSLLTKS